MALWLFLPVALGACASPTGGWYHPARNAAFTSNDFAACQAEAEETTLELRRTDRQGYGLERTDMPGVFNPRGDNTMAIAERSDTSALYSALVDRCMISKGYRNDD